MKKGVKIFFETIARSVYSPRLYGELRSRPVSRALVYFLLLSLTLTAVQIAVASVPLATTFPEALRASVRRIVEAYPIELKVTIEDGKARVNVPEPYFIELPPWQTGGGEEEARDGGAAAFDGGAAAFDGGGFRIVIDTKTPFSASQFDEYGARVWLARDAVIVRSGEAGSGEFQAYGLRERVIRDTVITKDAVRRFEEIVQPYFKLASFFYGVALFFGFLVFYALHLVYNFFLALLVFLLARLRRDKLPYMKSYAVGLHAMTLPLAANAVLTMLKVESPVFLFTLLALAVVAANLSRKPEISRA